MSSGSLSVRLTTAEFQRISAFIYDECGINLTAPKKVMVESRLQRRLLQLKMSSFNSYCDYVMTPMGMKEELVHMIDAVATNKTDFFREPVHFRFMEEQVLPAWRAMNNSRVVKVWSSACSTGEEPYTTAMVLAESAAQQALQFSITATDISTKVLQKAIHAIYPERSAVDIPMALRRKYLLKSKDQEMPTVRIVPELRSKVLFKRVNLTEDVIEVEPDFDVIFCRNVLIYFDRATQEQVVSRLCQKLRRGGYLFIGHSESIYHMKLPLRQVQPTIFQRI
jgi:chemotaxis protein methyltransferase CheR